MAEKEENDKGQVEEKALGQPAVDELAEQRDRLLRLAAEFDNYKKRVAKDVSVAKDAGRAEVISKLLPTIDEFELAMVAFGKDDEHMKGMELIFSNLMSSLRSFGLREIEVKGRFDPYRHETVLVRESDRPDGEIIEVVRKGYMLNDIMIRPASVIIAKAAKKEEEKQKGE